MTTPRKFGQCAVLGVVFSFAALDTMPALAQDSGEPVLEEIIVTAQRREQLLQEVPLSIEVFSGSLIRQQGFRDLDALANFSTNVLILPRVQDQDISIRGFGTSGNALTLDQAAPTFVDGIHFGRSSQTRLAYMDVQSVEILKGPQPVFFGQNATAGAFNIRSRGPTDSWEAIVDLEAGENETIALDAGVGGPLGDTFGIRVAGKYDTTDGFLEDVVTGEMLGDFENIGGRVILEWTPTDAFQVTGKYEASQIRKDSETTYVCRSAGPVLYDRGGPTDDPDMPKGIEMSIWVDPDIDPMTMLNSGGSGWVESHTPLDTDCFSSDKGVSNGGPYFLPPDEVRQTSASDILDIRAAAEAFTVGDRNKTTGGYEDIDADNGYIELAYEFGNGVTAEWLSGWSNYDRDYALENTNAPFLSNLQARGEEFEQLSSELRFTSSGDGPIEWMVGAYWQDTDLFAWSSSLRANVRRGQRYNEITEDVEYKAVFGTVTFNFWDDKMSLDLGARYADVDKSTTIVGYGATWVFNVEPVSEAPGGPPGCTKDDLPIGFGYCAVDPATARIFLPVDPAAGLWTIHFRDTRNAPDEWQPSLAQAVGLTPKDFNAPSIEGPYAESLSDSNTDPQITLRYRPTDNLSFYARYAEAFKVGGFETGQTSIPDFVDFQFEPEEAETIELGVKGTAWDGRFGFEATLFELEVTDLQTTTVSTDPNQTSETVNADQRVRGLFEKCWNYYLAKFGLTASAEGSNRNA